MRKMGSGRSPLPIFFPHFNRPRLSFRSEARNPYALYLTGVLSLGEARNPFASCNAGFLNRIKAK